MAAMIAPPPMIYGGACTTGSVDFDEARGVKMQQLALATCSMCPVQNDCLAWCVSWKNDTDPLAGMVAGGMLTWQRQMVREGRKDITPWSPQYI